MLDNDSFIDLDPRRFTYLTGDGSDDRRCALETVHEYAFVVAIRYGLGHCFTGLSNPLSLALGIIGTGLNP